MAQRQKNAISAKRSEIQGTLVLTFRVLYYTCRKCFLVGKNTIKKYVHSYLAVAQYQLLLENDYLL